MLNIEVINKIKENFVFNLEEAKKTGGNLCKKLNYRADAIVEIFFVSNDEIKKINKQFRNKDRATDVLSFPMDKNIPGKNKLLGTIFIAPSFVDPTKMSCNDLFEHGLLHLLGFDHEKNKNDWDNAKKTLIL